MPLGRRVFGLAGVLPTDVRADVHEVRRNLHLGDVEHLPALLGRRGRGRRGRGRRRDDVVLHLRGVHDGNPGELGLVVAGDGGLVVPATDLVEGDSVKHFHLQIQSGAGELGRLPLGGGVLGHAGLFPSDVRADADEIFGNDGAGHVGSGVLRGVACGGGGVRRRVNDKYHDIPAARRTGAGEDEGRARVAEGFGMGKTHFQSPR